MGAAVISAPAIKEELTSDNDDDPGARASQPPMMLVPPEQTESALGHSLATEFDEDLLEAIDLDQRAEEEALLGRQVNPTDANYACLCWSPPSGDATADVASLPADSVGWDQSLPLRELCRSDFAINPADVQGKLQQGIKTLYSTFAQDAQDPRGADAIQQSVETLDPTQREAYKFVLEWAKERLTWRDCRRSHSLKAPPSLKLLLLGTAGSGKTHTAKTFIAQCRRMFGTFDSVLTMAFSGVAAANLGEGARTIDSVFHTNAADATKDLVGESLDKLVAELRSVQLVVIDEISTVGAAQFEIVSRRLEQVSRVLYRERFREEPPQDFGGFGAIGVVCMGDFAQLPPVLATSLLSGTPLQDSKNSGLRSFALAGRQLFQTFTHVVRLRRIHRIKAADHYKDSTMRLRDAAITVEDHKLWQEHEIDSLEDPSVVSWPGGEGLLDVALCLVADNAQAGRINGMRLAAAAPFLNEPSSGGSDGNIVVRLEARHNNAKGEARRAEDFRNMRKATHLRVGARVILTLSSIWDVGTVPLGLMNGARGIVVAILYPPKGRVVPC